VAYFSHRPERLDDLPNMASQSLAYGHKIWLLGHWGAKKLPEHQKFVATRVITTDSTTHNHTESSTRNQI
jgi:hypothetical protein